MKSDIGTQKKKVICFGQIDFFSRRKSFWPKRMTFFSGFQCHFSSRDVDMHGLVLDKNCTVFDSVKGQILNHYHAAEPCNVLYTVECLYHSYNNDSPIMNARSYVKKHDDRCEIGSKASVHNFTCEYFLMLNIKTLP